MAHVALVTYYAPPQGAIASHRILRLSRELLRAGHRVAWVTLDPDRLDERSTDATLARLIPPQVEQHGIAGPCIVKRRSADTLWRKARLTAVTKLQRWFALPDGSVGWVLALFRRLAPLARREGWDTLFFCCGPHGPVLLLPRIRRALPGTRLLVDYRDLLSGNAWNQSAESRHRGRVLARERKGLEAADGLFVNSSDALESFRSIVRPREDLPVHVMRNAADFALVDRIEAPAADLGPGVHLGFFGTVFDRRRLRPVIDSLVALPPDRRAPFRLHCYSVGQSRDFVAQDCVAAGLALEEHVRFHDYLPYGPALRAMEAMDALVLVNGPTVADRIFVPGKLYDYLMARRPILFVGEPGDAWRIVADSCGEEWCSRHTEPERRAAALERLAGGRLPTVPVQELYGPTRTFEPLLRLLGPGS